MNPPVSLRRLAVDIASGDALDVRRFHVTAAMSGLFEAQVTCVSENPDIDLEAVAGQAASLQLRWGAGEARSFSGIARSFEQIAAEETGLSTYRLSIVPALWLATQRRDHRIYQRMSEVDIVLDVLGRWGISPLMRLSGVYPKREYRVQYGETDFTFVCRLLEDIGASFHFDAESGASLVIADEPQTAAPRAPLPYRDHPTVADREHATSVHVGRNVRPGLVTLGDHDERRPQGYKVSATAQGAGGVEAALESYHYAPGAFLIESDRGDSTPVADAKGKYRIDDAQGAALAQKRVEAARATARAVTFETNAHDLGPGTVVGFLDHPRSDLAPGKQFLVIGLELRGALDETWSCACRAVAADVPYRPALATERPLARGVESATVVGPPGEEIHTDELGRVRVQFHWDRLGKMDDGSSCWIHVSQPWSGAGFGATNLPRVGQEVIVDFLGGDPDRPVITGRVFTGPQRTPYKLPEQRTRSGWKSSSTGQTGGYNEIMFEDLAGKELVSVQAERDMRRLVKHDEDAVVGRDRSRLVKRDEKITVQNDRSLAVDHDQSAMVGHDETRTIGHDATSATGNDRSETVGHDAITMIGNDHTHSVQASQSESVGLNRSRFVGATESVQIGQDQTSSIGGSQSLQVSESQSVQVGESQSVKIGGGHSLKVGKMSTETVALVKALSVGVAYQITVGGAMNTTVTGISKEQVGRTKHVVAGKEVEIVCGKSKLVLEASGKVTIEGTEIVFKSTGPVTIAGKEVKVDGDEITVTAKGKAQIEGPNVKIKGDPIEMNPPDAN